MHVPRCPLPGQVEASCHMLVNVSGSDYTDCVSTVPSMTWEGSGGYYMSLGLPVFNMARMDLSSH